MTSEIIIRPYVPTTHTIHTISKKEYIIDSRNLKEFTSILEKSKFITIGDSLIAVHQITSVNPTEESEKSKSERISEYNKAIASNKTLEEYIYTLPPDIINDYAEQLKNRISEEKYKWIKSAAMDFTN